MLSYFEISLLALVLALSGAFLMGVAKTGLPGLALVNVIVMAHLFGKESVGIVLPLLVVCDVVIYPIYRKYASWQMVWPLMIPGVVGVLIGYFILDAVDDTMTKRVIGWTIAGLLGLQLVQRYSGSALRRFPDSLTFLIGAGLTIGVSTTVANAAGPAYSVWALVRRLSKEDFLGIGARFFLCINLLKVPLNAEIGIINPKTLLLDLTLLPAVLAGIAIGRQVVKRLRQEAFEWVLFAMSAVGAAWLILV